MISLSAREISTAGMREVAGEFLRGPHRVSRRRSALRDLHDTVDPLPHSAQGRSASRPILEFVVMKHSWIRNLFARPVTRTIRKAPRRVRPALEMLEDRCVPSTFTVLNTLDDGTVGSLR